MKPAIKNNHYVKHHGPTTTQDFVRVQLFAELVGRVAGLRTATPVSMNATNGTIEYERLENLQPLLFSEPLDERKFRRFGVLLSELHRCELPASSANLLPAYPLEHFALNEADKNLIEKNFSIGFFWGDCWHGNVFLQPNGTFAVIDPLPHRWLFADTFLMANGAIDLAMLHMSLFFSHPLSTLIRFDPLRSVPAGRALLEGYLESIDATRAMPAVLHLSRALATLYIEAYRRRLIAPVALVKRKLSMQVMAVLDKHEWEVN